MYNNKNIILQRLLMLSRDITTFVSISGNNIDDLTYQMQVKSILSQFNMIVGYQNFNLISILTGNINMINIDTTKSNSIKLLSISNQILNIGYMLR